MARILVAEDDNICRMPVCHLIASAGHEVIETCDGRQALAACLHSPAPDVAVLDYEMPHPMGLEVAEGAFRPHRFESYRVRENSFSEVRIYQLAVDNEADVPVHKDLLNFQIEVRDFENLA